MRNEFGNCFWLRDAKSCTFSVFLQFILITFCCHKLRIFVDISFVSFEGFSVVDKTIIKKKIECPAGHILTEISMSVRCCSMLKRLSLLTRSTNALKEIKYSNRRKFFRKSENALKLKRCQSLLSFRNNQRS